MKRLLFAIALMWGVNVLAQTPVEVSDMVVLRNGKKCYVHILKKGQTVYSISRAYGLREYEAITTKDIHQLEVGDTVWLPCKDDRIPLSPTQNKTTEERTIVVQAGQTLYGISKMYGITIEQLTEANPGVAETGLKEGQTLIIPSATASRTAPANKTSDKAPASQGTSQLTENSQPVIINKRVNQQTFRVTLMMPLYLDQVQTISTTKFDLEQRGKKSYKPFEFVQFYEGILMGLDQLSANGIQTELNVVDISTNTPADIDKAWTSHDIEHSDLIIALLQKDMFAHAAQLAADNHIFIVNPMSTRSEITANPYVIKCMPSIEGQTRIILTAIRKYQSDAQLVVIHSNGKDEAPYFNEIKKQLEERQDIQYTLFDWKAANKLSSVIKSNQKYVVLNIYNQGRDKNRIQLSNMLNKLAAYKANPPILMSYVDYTKEYSDVDFAQLQLLNYHTFNTDLDPENQKQQTFMENYRDTYKTEPVGTYAPMGYDIMVFFMNGLQQCGMDFFKTLTFPQHAPENLLQGLRFKHPGQNTGFENQTAPFLKMNEYKFCPATSNKK